MKQTKAIEFQLTDKEKQELFSVCNTLEALTAKLPSGYTISTYDNATLTMDEINTALHVVYSLESNWIFYGYNTSEEEN